MCDAQEVDPVPERDDAADVSAPDANAEVLEAVDGGTVGFSEGPAVVGNKHRLDVSETPAASETLAASSEATGDDGSSGLQTGSQEDKAKPSKTLEQMMSLREDDDETTGISKKISWILRHGARKVNLEIDADGWVSLDDLLSCEILKGVALDTFLRVVAASNEQKPRYEVRTCEDGTLQALRAMSKHTIGGLAGMPAKEQRERRQRRENEVPWSERDDRGQVPRERPWRRDYDDGPTYEQQIRNGLVPVYQGTKVVAMAREGGDETVKPGRRAEDDRQERDSKGKGRGAKGADGRESRDIRSGDPRRREEDNRDTRTRWRVNAGQDAIVRAKEHVASESVGRLAVGAVVVQTGKEVTFPNGIVRMPIESEDGIRGWVTRTAAAAGGPAFFRQERVPTKGRDGKDGGKGREKGRKGDRGAKGKGRREHDAEVDDL